MTRFFNAAEVRFPPPAHGPFAPVTQLDAGSVQRRSVQDHVLGVSTYVTDAVGGIFGEGILRFDDIDTEVIPVAVYKVSWYPQAGDRDAIEALRDFSDGLFELDRLVHSLQKCSSNVSTIVYD